MKKTLSALSALLCLLLLLTALPVSFAAGAGKYKVTAEAAGVFRSADITSEKLCEVYAGTVLEVVNVQRGFGQVWVRSAGVTGWVQIANLEYLGGGTAGNVTGIRVTPPDRTTLIHGVDSLDLTGMKVYAVYEGGMQVTVTGYQVFCDTVDTLGEKEVRVTYSPKDSSVTFTDSFKVNVVRYPVTRQTLIKEPDRSLYLEHEKLDLSGLVVKLSYSDGRPEQMFAWEDIAADPHFAVTGCCGEDHGKTLEKGTHTVTLYYRYEDISSSFMISVAPRRLVSLYVAQQPDSLVTHHRDRAPDISGLMLKAEYDNGESELVESYDCEVVCDPSAFVLGENNPVDVFYGGLSVRLYYRLSLNNATGIRAIPSKTAFIQGEEIDPGLKVRLEYADGTYETLTDYEMTAIDPDKLGSQNLIVRWGEFSDVYTISITAYHRVGDVNGDGKVEPEDARLTLRAAVGLIHYENNPVTLRAADADKDGHITPADARLILRASVGLETL